MTVEIVFYVIGWARVEIGLGMIVRRVSHFVTALSELQRRG